MTTLLIDHDPTGATMNGEELIPTKLRPSLLCSVVTVETFDKDEQSIGTYVGTLESFNQDPSFTQFQFRYSRAFVVEHWNNQTFKIYQ